MSRGDPFPRMAMRSVAVLVVALLASCSTEASHPTTPTVSTVTARAPGGNGGGGGSSPSVDAANPSNLPRGSVNVDLEIIGSGFASNSDVEFEIDEVPTDAIVTNSVTFIDETLLIANVDVSDDAIEDLYDIAVRNGPKKKGVGIDLLRVVAPISYPVVQGVELQGDFVGDVSVLDALGTWLSGRDEECGFVYHLDTGVKDCLEVPGTDDVWPLGINDSGLIAGTAYDAGVAVPFVLDYSADPATVTLLQAPAGWSADGMHTGALESPINAQGEIAGWVKRSVQVRRNKTTVERALVLWNRDGAVAAVSAPTEAPLIPPHGISDRLPDGSLIVVANDNRVWDGADGTALTALDEGTYQFASVEVVAPDGTLFGVTGKGEVIRWSEPSTSPTLLVQLGPSSSAGSDVFAVDRQGNILVRVDSTGYCVSRSNPVAGVVELANLPGFYNPVPHAGVNGKVFGYSFSDTGEPQRPVVWDIGTVPSGCSAG